MAKRIAATTSEVNLFQLVERKDMEVSFIQRDEDQGLYSFKVELTAEDDAWLVLGTHKVNNTVPDAEQAYQESWGVETVSAAGLKLGEQEVHMAGAATYQEHLPGRQESAGGLNIVAEQLALSR